LSPPGTLGRRGSCFGAIHAVLLLERSSRDRLFALQFLDSLLHFDDFSLVDLQRLR
jgi:hypothetical protein